MNLEDRVSNLDTMIAENRLLRRRWMDGQERACLLAALSPEAGVAQSAAACPAEVMPQWMAQLTVWIDDNPSDAHWPEVVLRYAGVVRRWHALDVEAWRRAGFIVGAAIMRVARREEPDEWGCRDALDAMVGLFDRSAAGAVVSQDEWRRAAAEAAGAAEAARAAWAAEAAWAAGAAEAARAAGAADRVADVVLDALEAAVTRSENGGGGEAPVVGLLPSQAEARVAAAEDSPASAMEEGSQ